MHDMKSAVILLLCIFCLAGSVQAYVLTISAPKEITAGAPLEVTGDTTFPVGTQFDIVIYKLQPATPQEVARKMVIIDESKSFQLAFPTTGLGAGNYKAEVKFPLDPGQKLSSDSVTLTTFTILDRSGEIVLTVDTEQELGEALRIEGYIPKAGVTTITLKVSGPQGAVVPPQDVRTTTRMGKDEGYFTKTIKVEERGNYYVDFYDIRGFMATITFMVDPPSTATPSPTIETVNTTADVPVLPRASAPLAGCLGGILGAAAIVWYAQGLKR